MTALKVSFRDMHFSLFTSAGVSYTFSRKHRVYRSNTVHSVMLEVVCVGEGERANGWDILGSSI